tara:strand:- start:75 stop:215 length:141 start_codon:yes stop_codon:yes gene_type:complete
MIFIYSTKDLPKMNDRILLNMKKDLQKAIKEIDNELETPIYGMSSS